MFCVSILCQSRLSFWLAGSLRVARSMTDRIHPLSIEAIVLAGKRSRCERVKPCIHPLSIEAIVLAPGRHGIDRRDVGVSILCQSRLSFWRAARSSSVSNPNSVSILCQSRLSFWRRSSANGTVSTRSRIHPLSIEAIVLASLGSAPMASVWTQYPSSVNRGYRSGFLAKGGAMIAHRYPSSVNRGYRSGSAVRRRLYSAQ